MAFTTVPDKSVGDPFTEAMWDTYIRDNFNKSVVRPINQIYVAIPAGGIDFVNIPADFGHLLFVGALRTDAAIQYSSAFFRFNLDSSPVYNYHIQGWNGGTAIPTEVFGAQSGELTQITGASGGFSYAPFFQIVPQYPSAGPYKSWIGQGGVSFASGPTGHFGRMYHGRWDSAAAITRFYIFPGAGNFAVGSWVTVYGLGV